MFEKHGIDIDEFAVDLEQATHEAIHGGGDWRLGRAAWEGEWNQQILLRLKQATRAARGRLGTR